jgi:hypothetical protein
MTEIKYKDSINYSVFDKRTCELLFEHYFLHTLSVYKNLAEDKNMLIVTSIENVEVSAQTIENMQDEELHFASKETPTLMLGNIKDMKIRVAKLLASYLTIMSNHKDIVDLSYDKIMEVVFKSREREKDTFTDRLQAMTDEERDADTILKINKLGLWSKGMQKGLTTLDKDFYDEEQEFRDKMNQAERNIRRKNPGANDENIDILLDDYIEQQQIDQEIDDEVYDMEFMNETFWDGNTDGVGAPEEEYDDYQEDN